MRLAFQGGGKKAIVREISRMGLGSRVFLGACIALFASGITEAQVNPVTGIDWPLATNNSTPSGTCGASSYGEPYLDTATNVFYVCGSSGWAPFLPMAGGTLTGPLYGPQFGAVLQCDQYAGFPDVSVQANNCNTAAVSAGGGTIDLRKLLAGKTTGSEEIEINTPAGSSAGVGVTALFPTTGTYTTTLLGGPATSAVPYSSSTEGSGYSTGDLVYPTESGFGFTGAATSAVFSVTASGGAVTALTLVSGGSGYLTSKYLTTSTNHSGSGLIINLQAADCGIRMNGSATLQTGSVGAGATTFQIVPQNWTATATATQVGGHIQTAIPVTYVGYNYTSAPTVTITGSGGGSGATATANLSGNTVGSITLTFAGMGYSGTITVTITPPNGPTLFRMQAGFCSTAGYNRQEGGLKSDNFTGMPVFTAGTDYITNNVDQSSYELLESSTPYDDGVDAENFCCGTNFYSLHADNGGGATAGIPLIFGAGGVIQNACTTSTNPTLSMPYGHMTIKYLGDVIGAGTSGGGTNFPSGTIITGINSLTSVTTSQNATATSGGQAACMTPSLTGGSGLTLNLSDPTRTVDSNQASVYHEVANDPGMGLPNILVTQFVKNLSFFGGYNEPNQPADAYTPMIDIANEAATINFYGMELGASDAGKYGIRADTKWGWCFIGGTAGTGFLDQGVFISPGPTANGQYCKGGMPYATNGTNLLPDTNFKQGSLYWSLPSGVTPAPGLGAKGDNALSFTLSGTPSSTIYIPVNTSILNFQANQNYTFGANINALNLTGGTISVELCSNATCSSTYGQAPISTPQAGMVLATVNLSSFTGPYFVIVLSGVTGSGTVTISEPFLVGGINPAYAENDLGFGSVQNSGASFSSLNLATPLAVAYGGTGLTTLTLAQTFAAAAHNYLTSYTASTGIFTAAQPVSADLSDLGSASGAAQLNSSGFLPVAQGGTGVANAGANTLFGNSSLSSAPPGFFSAPTGSLVGTGQSNTWATGTTQNFSGATQIVLPVHGGYTSAGNGELGFDSTYHNWHAYANGGDQYVALFSTGSPPTNGNCAQWAVGGGFYELGQASGPCVVARASGAYTTATSDSFTVTGATASSHCVFSPTNSIAASSSVVGYVSSVGANTVTITHAATVASGGTINIICTPN